MGPGGFSWFTERSNACGQLRQGAPDHSCFQTTGCSTAHGSGGPKSCLRRSQIVSFDLWLRDSKHSKRFSDGLSEKIVCVPVGFTHTHPPRFCSASGLVSICVASWKLMTSLSAFALMRPLTLAWCGHVCPIPFGALRWACSRRDFSGLESAWRGDNFYRHATFPLA